MFKIFSNLSFNMLTSVVLISWFRANQACVLRILKRSTKLSVQKLHFQINIFFYYYYLTNILSDTIRYWFDKNFWDIRFLRLLQTLYCSKLYLHCILFAVTNLLHWSRASTPFLYPQDWVLMADSFLNYEN